MPPSIRNIVPLLLAATAALSASTLYQVTDLGAINPAFEIAAVNSRGQIVGGIRDTAGEGHAVLYSDGRFIQLGTLGGRASGALAINDQGQITGASYKSTGDVPYPFLYENGQMTELALPPTGYRGGTGIAINNLGQVTGYLATTLPRGDYHVFISNANQVTDLGAPSNSFYTIGYGINDHGMIAGQYSILNGPTQSFLYSDGRMTDLGTLGGRETFAYAINNLGQITGGGTVAGGGTHAFLYNNGQLTDLDVLLGANCGVGRSINDLGQILATCMLPGTTTFHATLITNGVAQDLNGLIDPTLGITLLGAGQITNNGIILADGDTPDGRSTHFLLTPVPEPATLVLAAILVAFGCAYRCRSRVH